MKKSRLILILILLIFAKNVLAETPPPCDPYERFNRAMFVVNDALDFFIVKPLATLYNAILPKPVIKSINNFFNNLNNIPTVANDLLQANFYQAVSDSWRFAINSTVGIFGLFDPAQCMGLEPNCEDLGLTFARWGWENSNFIMIPFIGPSTIRDTIAWPINYRFLTIYPYIHPVSLRYSLYGLGVIDRRADLLRMQNVFNEAVLDKYIFIRDAYLQHRHYAIERNKELNNPYLERNCNLEHKTITSPEEDCNSQ